MTDEVHALIGFERYYPGADNVIRVFSDRDDAEKWAVLLECAARDAHFPVTYAELKQDFDWVPEHSSGQYDVVSHEVHDSGWD